MIRRFVFLLTFTISFQTFSKNILIIGDSHGALSQGWAHQLAEMRANDSIFNLAISGNTIGFQNNGQDTLNTLKNIDSYFERAEKHFKQIDAIIILLGTNDCKAVFASKTKEVEQNLDSLLTKINEYFLSNKTPQLIYVSPPPMADDKFLAAKYVGGNERLKTLVKTIKTQATKHHFTFVDIFHPLWKERNTLTADGVHYKPEGYKKMADIIRKKLNQ
ncbi:Lipolytic protein G-D-S-L family (fragment) [uncultured Paludibacter sp.]|uniref:Lipolytic protein G-D-S-L family n=1 Tax=uncultured Paludibacter sp. TaxID=497635 RepID=A0A653A6K6_9BACT